MFPNYAMNIEANAQYSRPMPPALPQSMKAEYMVVSIDDQHQC